MENPRLKKFIHYFKHATDLYPKLAAIVFLLAVFTLIITMFIGGFSNINNKKLAAIEHVASDIIEAQIGVDFLAEEESNETCGCNQE